MKSVAVLLILALGLGVSSPAQAKAPPSFALWSARESNYDDALLAHAKNGKDVLAVLVKAKPHWERGLTTVAKPQTKPCRNAIHLYWLAAVKYFSSETIYARGHQAASVLAVGSALTSSEPYATLSQLKESAKSHAVRVCG